LANTLTTFANVDKILHMTIFDRRAPAETIVRYIPHERVLEIYDALAPFMGNVSDEEWESIIKEERITENRERMDKLHDYLVENVDAIQNAEQLRALARNIVNKNS